MAARFLAAVVRETFEETGVLLARTVDGGPAGAETAAALAPFLSATPLDNMPDATFDDANVREGLAGSGISCPPIDGALLRRYFEWFIDCGYLPAPSSLDLPESAAS